MRWENKSSIDCDVSPLLLRRLLLFTLICYMLLICLLSPSLSFFPCVRFDILLGDCSYVAKDKVNVKNSRARFLI